MTDFWGVVANNYTHKRFRKGAKVWLQCVTGGGLCSARAEFYGMSPGGRMIECWAPFKCLKNFRSAWVPEHLRGEKVFFVFEDRTETDRWVADLLTC